MDTKGGEKMYRENVPERLRKAREEAGYTQQQIQDMTAIRRQNISKYETGALEPNLEVLGTLAQLYNVTSDWLLGVSIIHQTSNKKNYDNKNMAQ